MIKDDLIKAVEEMTAAELKELIDLLEKRLLGKKDDDTKENEKAA